MLSNDWAFNLESKIIDLKSPSVYHAGTHARPISAPAHTKRPVDMPSSACTN